MKHHLYFQIAFAVRLIEQNSALKDLDPLSREILEYIGIAEVELRDIRVTDVVSAFSNMHTGPTIYWRIGKLEKEGLIEAHTKDGDRRVKLLRLSRGALSIYGRMSNRISAVTGG